MLGLRKAGVLRAEVGRLAVRLREPQQEEAEQPRAWPATRSQPPRYGRTRYSRPVYPFCLFVCPSVVCLCLMCIVN